MLRIAGVSFLLLMLAGLLGCPKPVERIGADVAAPGSVARGGVIESEEYSASLGSDSAPPPQGADQQESSGAAGEVGPDQPANVGPLPPVGTSPKAAGTEAAGPQPPGGAAGPDGEVGPQPPAPQYGALDAENFMGDTSAEEPWGRPEPKLDRDARSYTGRWKVAVLNRQGKARLLEDPDEWVLTLDPGGQFYAKQVKGGQTWRQQGTWELSGVQLRLRGGPGGERAYDVSREMDDIMVLADAGRQTALFCVRILEGAAPAVQARYDSDFGVINLRPSGPAHWRGAYGQPEGTLLVAQLGGYLVGTWEQSPSRGFVIFELRQGGLSGGWWYEKSRGFDGRWFAVAAR